MEEQPKVRTGAGSQTLVRLTHRTADHRRARNEWRPAGVRDALTAGWRILSGRISVRKPSRNFWSNLVRKRRILVSCAFFLLRTGALTENDLLAGGERAAASRRLAAGVATRSSPLYPSAGLGRPRSAEPRGSTESILAWLWLATAGLLEIVWAIGLKYTDGFSRFWPSVVTLAAMALSMVCLGVALKTLPVGTAYAVWVGIGALGTAVLGIVLFDESREPLRLLCLLLILAGVVGLKLVSREAS
jgi:quaternary ammonium compound-resistance protein SugE